MFPKGLYSFVPSDTESVLYPMRCYDFLGDLVYFLYASEAYSCVEETDINSRCDILRSVINNNSACTVPLLDTHSIPILLVFHYLYSRSRTKEDRSFVAEFIIMNVINMMRRHASLKVWPEMNGNRVAVAKSLYVKSDDYCSDSSLLILTLVELAAYMNLELLYEALRKHVEESSVNLQVAYPIADEYDVEQLLFEHRLYDEMSVMTNFTLPDTLEEFRKSYVKPYDSIPYRTDKANYAFLRLLAHKYYETDFFPDFLGRTFCREVGKSS